MYAFARQALLSSSRKKVSKEITAVSLIGKFHPSPLKGFKLTSAELRLKQKTFLNAANPEILNPIILNAGKFNKNVD